MAFEIFNRRLSPGGSGLSVRCMLNIIKLSLEASAQIPDTEMVEALWDRETGMVAIRPTTESHGYRLAKRSREYNITGCVDFLKATDLQGAGVLPATWKDGALQWKISPRHRD